MAPRKAKLQPTVTLTDVGREAGVSEITVSRVIRSKGPIAQSTRDRVEAAIRRVGYVPNRIAGSLATASSDLIGVVIPSLDNIVFPDVLRGLNAATAGNGSRVVVASTDYDPDTERELVRSLLSWRPAALIVTGTEHTPETRAMLQNCGIVVIEIMDTDGPTVDIAIGMSHRHAGRGMATHLAGRFYRRFGYVGHDLARDLRAAKRLDGFLAGLAAAERTLHGEMIMPGPSSAASGREGTARLLAAHPDIDAIYFSNDDMAMGGFFHCLAEGIAVPQRLAIAGFNGLDIGQVLPKPLTTTLTHRFEIGARAGAAVMSRLAGEAVDPVIDLGFDLLAGATA